MQVLKTQVRVHKGGKRKYGKLKYEFTGLEYAGTENVSTPVNTNCRVRLNFTK